MKSIGGYMKKIKVYLGLPTTGSVVDSQSYFLREIADLYKESVELVYPTQCVRRMFHDFARNAIVDDFLETDCDVLWFIDSDITPSKHALDLIVNHYDKWQVSGLTYPVFMTPPGYENPQVVFTVYQKNPESGNLTPANSPKSGSKFVDGLATGCLFIKREVFSLLTKPYFEFKYKDESREMAEGEDLGFCRKLSTLGIQLYTDFDLICKHQKSVDLLDVNNYAIDYSNRSVLAYDAAIKGQAVASVQEAYDAGYKKAIEDIHKKFKGKGLEIKPKSVIWTQN